VDALRAIGVRLAGAQELLGVIDAWRAENGDAGGPSQASQNASAAAAAPATATSSSAVRGEADGSGSSGAVADAPLPIPPGPFTPPRAWPLAKPLPPAGKKAPPWEESWKRLSRGESPEVIAMQQPSGKPIATSTVIGHGATALTYGRPVDIQRLASFAASGGGVGGLPTMRDWDRLRDAEVSLQLDVTLDEKAGATQLLADFLPAAATAFDQRTEADKASLAPWWDKVKWYMALRRAGYEPAEVGPEPGGKRPRLTQ